MDDMAKKSITSYDVARAAGVSQSAVSRAFSPTASIARKTRQHILDVAHEMGYQPNAIARSMSSARSQSRQRSGIVGVIVTRLEDPFFAQTIAYFNRNLQTRGWHMLLFTVESESEVDSAL
ncbi:MAG: LacI family DNA-binding transcriptional regulator, partial [Alphaproteobacteria bacterium]